MKRGGTLKAMNRMYPNDVYLDYAEKMAAQFQSNQNEDGSWSFIFDGGSERSRDFRERDRSLEHAILSTP